MWGELLRLVEGFVLTVNSSEFFATLTGKGRCQTLGLVSDRRDDRRGRLGGDEPLDRRDRGRSIDDGGEKSMLATVIMGEMDNIGRRGGEFPDFLESGSGLESGLVSCTIMGEKLHTVEAGALGVTGVVASCTVSGIFWVMPCEDGFRGPWLAVALSSLSIVGVSGVDK